MMKANLLGLLCLFALFLPNAICAEPSAEETIDYIKNKFTGECDWSVGVSAEATSRTTLLISDGKLVVSNREITVYSAWLADWGTSHRTIIKESMLNDLDPRVTVRNGQVGTCITVDYECSKPGCIKSSFRNNANGKIIKRDEFLDKGQFTMGGTRTDAERFTKALSHLIKLNGGKEQLF